MKELPIHPVAALYPMMGQDEMAELAKSIKAHGQHDPIKTVMIDGIQTLIDGRNRLAACELAGVHPWIEDITEDVQNVGEYILDTNSSRRHLTQSQKAMVAQGYLVYERKESERRQTLGKVLPKVSSGKSVEIAAAKTGANPEYVRQAEKIQQASPEIAAEVAAGKKTIHKAMQEIKAQQAARTEPVVEPEASDSPEEGDNDELATPAQGDTEGLDALKMAWADATAIEQGHFIRWLKLNKDI